MAAINKGLSLEEALERSKEFEQLVNTYDPTYKDLLVGIEIVKQFIIDNGLIIYGGSAIDYALRLFGDKIYPDELLPDLDFYSPNNVEHSYQLADILYARGYKAARSINAEHVGTMRVDIADNHFIADISYIPPDIFNTLPYLVFNGMKIIHPTFQRLDVHSALSFPYDNVPREVIFSRWARDIKRFNKLAEYYPVDHVDNANIIPIRPVDLPNSALGFVFNGFSAYSIIYSLFCKEHGSPPKDVIPAEFKVTSDGITISAMNSLVEIVHFNPEKISAELSLTNVRKFEPVISIIDEKLTGQWSPTDTKTAQITQEKHIDMQISSTRGRLLSINSVTLDEKTSRIRIVNAQYLMKYFLALHFVNKQSPKLANTYLAYYNSIINMIHLCEQAQVIVPPLFPSVDTFGSENINDAREIALSRLYNELDGTEAFVTPRNYYPDRSKTHMKGHPEFDPEKIVFFRMSGKEITAGK